MYQKRLRNFNGFISNVPKRPEAAMLDHFRRLASHLLEHERFDMLLLLLDGMCFEYNKQLAGLYCSLLSTVQAHPRVKKRQWAYCFYYGDRYGTKIPNNELPLARLKIRIAEMTAVAKIAASLYEDCEDFTSARLMYVELRDTEKIAYCESRLAIG
jgi:hypothetical protein